MKYGSIFSLGIKFDITFEIGPVALKFQRPSAHKHSVQEGPNFSKKEPDCHKQIDHIGKPQEEVQLGQLLHTFFSLSVLATDGTVFTIVNSLVN